VTSQLRLVQADEGRPVLGGRLTLKLSADDTGEAYSYLRGNTPPGLGPPLHVHELEDETFYVVRGTYEMQCGPSVLVAGPGSCLHLPRYIPHTFRNVSNGPGELVEFMTPGGIERYFDAVEHLGPEAEDLDARNEIGRPYGLTFVDDPGAHVDSPAGEKRRPITFTARGDGRRVDLAGVEATSMVEGADTDGRHSLLEVTLPAGANVPAPAADQRLVVVLSGSVTIDATAGSVEAGAGDSIAVLSAGEVAVATDGRPAQVLLFSIDPHT
jgi:mannose-6-phosphate isomerase-like protein (cupin superfamily)